MLTKTTQSVLGWDLTFFSDAEPRIHDEELARRLGFERPRDIRKLIKRLLTEGILNDSDICATVAQNADPLGRGRPSLEYYLTDEAALLVTSQSKTDTARAVTRGIMRVFIEVHRGSKAIASAVSTALAPVIEEQRSIRADLAIQSAALVEALKLVQQNAADIQAMRAVQNDGARYILEQFNCMRGEFGALVSKVDSVQSGYANAAQVQQIRDLVRTLSCMLAATGKAKNIDGGRSSAWHALRVAIGKDCTVKRMPLRAFVDARDHLERRISEESKAVAAKKAQVYADKQQSLFVDPPGSDTTKN